jgi:predicted RNA binding protein YcfA (HicA-like mRNA interferase family)
MPKLPRISSKKLIKAIEKAGFSNIRSKGSHQTFVHADRGATTIPRNDKEIPVGTLHAILKDTDLTVEQLIELL